MYAIKVRPELMTAAQAIATQQRINDEDAAFFTSIDLPLLHRYIRDYGSKRTNAGFKDKLNLLHERGAELNNFMLSLQARYQGDAPLNDVDEVNAIYAEFVAKINAKNQARADLCTWIVNLKSSDFT